MTLQIISKENSELFQSILTSLAILVGGGWTFWRYVLQRESNSKIQFNVDLRVIGMQKGRYIVEVVAIVENKGLVRHHVSDFRFDLLYLNDRHDVVEGDERINGQILFEKIIAERYWIPPDWYSSFIDAGVTQHYTFTTYLPGDAKFALVYARFKYPGFRSNFHTSQKTFEVKLS